MNKVKIVFLAGIATLGLACRSTKSQQITGDRTSEDQVILKHAFQDKFYIGTALNLDQIWERNAAAISVVKAQFNSIVAENCMKSMYLQPREGEFNFKDADRFVAFGEQHGMHIIGHTLMWHSQTPNWFFLDDKGKDVSREVLIERMRKHIHTVVGRFKGRIHGWDVVNEAVLDNGELRKSKFYTIIGKDFIKLAFQFAQEADPDAEFYYNDYSTAIPAKRNGIIKLVKEVLDSGVRVDAIGMQEHNGLDNPALSEVEKSIVDFASLGTKVMVTEMDISVLPHVNPNMGAEISETYQYKNELNPYKEGLPDTIAKALASRYKDFFKLYLKHHDKITRVTVWGVGDGDSWKNGWPVPGRTDYPLLFDRDYKPKPFVKDLIELAKQK